MRAVDTNVLVRLIARDDDAQVSAAERFVERGAWVSQLALMEATWVLESVYDRTRANLAEAIDLLLDHEHLTVQDRDVVAAALRVFRAQRRVSFSDCLILEVARKAGHVPLATFDRDLARVDGTERL